VSIGVFSAVAPLGTLSIANIEAIRTATALYALIVIKGERLNALTNDTVTSIGRLPGRSNQRIVLYRIGTDYQVGWGNDNEGTTLMDIASAALDPDATYVIRVGSANGSGANASARMFRRDGTPSGVPVLAEDTAVIGNFGATTSGAQEWGVLAGSWRPEFDGFAWFTSKPADATICANPAVGLSGCVSLCTFESPLADAQSGATLTSSDVTIASGGTWDLLPRITAPAAGAALTVAQGASLSQAFAIDRRGNTNALGIRLKAGTPPSGASMADVPIANPATSGTGTIVATGSAPLVTADPIEFELVDGSTVLHTLACTLSITEATEPMAGPTDIMLRSVIQQRPTGATERPRFELRDSVTGLKRTNVTGVTASIILPGTTAVLSRSVAYVAPGWGELVLLDTDDATRGPLLVDIGGTAWPISWIIEIAHPDIRSTNQEAIDALPYDELNMRRAQMRIVNRTVQDELAGTTTTFEDDGTTVAFVYETTGLQSASTAPATP
jgi:hypothetical protein